MEKSKWMTCQIILTFIYLNIFVDNQKEYHVGPKFGKCFPFSCKWSEQKRFVDQSVNGKPLILYPLLDDSHKFFPNFLRNVLNREIESSTFKDGNLCFIY